MNDQDLGAAWTTLEATWVQRQRMEARVFSWLEARDTPLVREWLALFKVAPFATAGLVVGSAASLATALPVVWMARALL